MTSDLLQTFESMVQTTRMIQGLVLHLLPLQVLHIPAEPTFTLLPRGSMMYAVGDSKLEVHSSINSGSRSSSSSSKGQRQSQNKQEGRKGREQGEGRRQEQAGAAARRYKGRVKGRGRGRRRRMTYSICPPVLGVPRTSFLPEQR